MFGVVRAGFVADYNRERLHIHTVLQGSGGKGMSPVMEVSMLALGTL